MSELDRPTDSTQKKDKKTIASRGIPASESLYLPRHDSPELRNFQDQNESATRNVWGIDELVNFVFPKKYQPKYYAAAEAFLRHLCVKTSLGNGEMAEFIRDNNISKATFYNRVLIRLKRAGLVKVERDTIVAVENRRKFRPMRVSLSKTFGNYLCKIGDSWLATVDDARSRLAQKERVGRL